MVGGTLAFWCAGLYQDWLTGWHALLIGFLVAITAPLGDLFESLIKRDLAVKDTGTLFGAHGGVLDRLDAVLFSVRGVLPWFYAALGDGTSLEVLRRRRTSPARGGATLRSPSTSKRPEKSSSCGSTSSAIRRAKSGTLSLNVIAGVPSTRESPPPRRRARARSSATGALPLPVVGQLVGDVALEAEGELGLELPRHAGEDRPLGQLAAEAPLELGVAGASDEPRHRPLAAALQRTTRLLAQLRRRRPRRPPSRRARAARSSSACSLIT